MSVFGQVIGGPASPSYYGAVLTADLHLGDLVLYVDDAADFDEDAALNAGAVIVGTLLNADGSVNPATGVTMAYLTYDDDLDTVTLAAPSTVAALAGDRILIRNPTTGMPVGETEVLVSLDDDDETGDALIVTIPTSLLSAYAYPDLTNHAVEIDEDEDGQLVVLNLPGLAQPVPSIATTIPGLPAPPVLTDGLPPATSPTPTVTGGIGTLMVRWVPVTNADPVTYDLHVSPTTPWTPDSTTLAITTAGSSYTLRSLPTPVGNPPSTTLHYPSDTDPAIYYFKVIAHDADGQATVSAEGSGQMVQVTGPDVAAETITGNNIHGNTISGDLLSSTVILGSTISTGNIDRDESSPTYGQILGQRVDLDPTGIKVVNPAGVPIITLPTDPGQDARFEGTLVARNATIGDPLSTGGATFVSKNNAVAVNSSLSLASSVGDPTVKGAATIRYPSVKLQQVVRDDVFGPMALDPASVAAMAPSPTVPGIVLIAEVFGFGTRVWRYDYTTGQNVNTDGYYCRDYGNLLIAGMAVVGSTLRVFGYRLGYGWVVYDPTQSQPYNTYPQVNSDQDPAFGSDGTTFIVAENESDPATTVRVRDLGAWNNTPGPIPQVNVASTVVLGANSKFDNSLSYVGRGAFDFAAGTKLVYAPASSGGTRVTAATNGATRDATLSWPNGVGGRLAQCWVPGAAPSGAFFIFPGDGLLYRYTSASVADGLVNWWSALTWRNASGTRTTLLGPPAPATMVNRGQLVITVPPVPGGGGGVDDPTAYGLYMTKVASGTPTAFHLQATATPTPGASSTQSFTSVNMGGAAQPSSNNFPGSGNSGFLSSQKADSTGPLIQLNGDGSGRLGQGSWDATGLWSGIGSGGGSGGALDTYSGVCSATTLIDDTVPRDVTGCSFTISVGDPSDRFLMIATVDFTQGTSTTGVATVNLMIDGGQTGGSVFLRNPSSATSRATVGQNYIVSGLTAGTHPVKLQCGTTSVAGSWQVNPSHTRLTAVKLVGAPGPKGDKGDTGNTGSQGNVGPQGPQGNVGPQGPQGNVGPTGQAEGWWSGAGAPAGATGAVGDWYLDTTAGDVYEKTGTSAWTLRANIKGPQGIQGIQGNAGSQGLKGDPGSQGPQGNVGPQGPQGNVGPTGQAEGWWSQAGAPAGATGAVGDWSLDTTAGDVYEKTGASTWTLRGNIKGPQGAQGNIGPQGPQGNVGPTGQAEGWWSQAGAPAGGTGAVGDWSLDTTAGDVYEKTATSTWTLRGNIKGPQGSIGPQGPAGPAGSGAGDVLGPSGAVADDIATYNATTGKLIKDGGATIAQVRDRSTHTGSQAAATITGLAAIATSGSATDLSTGTVPIARVPTGQTGTTVPFGNDARFTDARTPLAHQHPASDVNSGNLDVARLGTTPAALTYLKGAASGAAGWATPATVKLDLALNNVPNIDATARANHTGTQSADTLTDGTTNKAFLATERTKLAGIATAATANSSDATLLNRANHTGTQAATTITGLAPIATSGSAADLSSGVAAVDRLGSPVGAGTYLKGGATGTTGTWQTIVSMKADLGVGQASGIASLDASTKLPLTQLPTHASSHASAGTDALSLSGAQITSGTVPNAQLPTNPLAVTELRTTKVDYNPAGAGDITFGVSVNMAGNYVYGVHTPTNVDHAMTKGYVDAMPFKSYVRVASTAFINLSTIGLGTAIDGVTLVAGDRVLVKDQTGNLNQNGIYIAATGAWTRAVDASTSALMAGAQVVVASGAVNGGTTWYSSMKSTDTINTTNMTWTPQLAIASGHGRHRRAVGALNTPVSVVVTFPTGRFVNTPSVVVSPGGGAPQTIAASWSATSNTGVTIWGARTSGALSAISINWLATAVG